MNRPVVISLLILAGGGLGGCGGPPLPPAPSYVITGSVTCRDPAPQPADAVLEVQLLGFARPDGPSELLNSVTVSPIKNWPVYFRLSYNPAQIQPAQIYTLRARLMAGGRIRFLNSAPAQVLTMGYPAERNLVLDSTAER